MDRHAAFDGVKYPNSWQILREHQNLAERPLKPGVRERKRYKEYHMEEFDWYNIPSEIHQCNPLRQHFQDRYYFELERKDKINSNISIYFGVTTLLVGAFIKLLDFIPQYELKNINFVFWASLFILVICLVVSSFYQTRALFKKYQYIITPHKWIKHANDTLNYYEKNGITDFNLDKDIESDITGQYAEYAEQNSISNDDKVADISLAKKWLIGALVPYC